MGRTTPRTRDRWVTIPGPARPRPIRTMVSVTPRASPVFDEEMGVASTASIFIEDERDDSPIPIGILDSEGHMIYRIQYRDTVPIGFHYTPDQYDEDGNFIGDDVEYYYDELPEEDEEDEEEA